MQVVLIGETHRMASVPVVAVGFNEVGHRQAPNFGDYIRRLRESGKFLD